MHLHSRGIIHQDVKARRTLSSCRTARQKLTDFSICLVRCLRRRPAWCRRPIGSSALYLAGQAKGSKIDYRTDLYSSA